MAEAEKKSRGKAQNKSPIAEREEKTLKFWEDKQIFKKSLEKPSPKGNFVFYDGPPFATGLPHYGHILAGTMKDAIPRYKTMQGYHVPRVWGWDTHGLPVENLIEKELELKSKKDIENYGIEKFNDAARKAVLRYDKEWKRTIPRTGRFIDMDHAYYTMDATYSESIWWSFKTLHDKGLIYQAFKPMHICPRDETTLSNFEVSQNYKDITDLSVYAKFELVDEPNTFVVAWTTTPWTLPGNIALAVNPDIEYVKLKIKGGRYKEQKYIIAKDRLAQIISMPNILVEGENGNKKLFDSEYISGKELVGKKYEPLFPYYKKADLKNKENAWKIVAADFVTVTDGTGIVHIAPGYGEDDYNLSLKENLPFLQHVGIDGRFKKEVKDFAGELVKPKDDVQKADIEIVKYLAKKNLLFAKEKIVHAYPHCWRCDTPLLNYAASSWFVKVTELKDKLVSENKKVKWVPAEIGEGRFGKWLEGARDWAISRSRFWGAPLPVWVCKDCGKTEVIGSVEALKQKTGGESPKNKKGELDLHRPFIDEMIWKCDCGGEYKRVPEVFDTWYESGSMPFSAIHYPFENKEKIEENMQFPADFIAEGQDQTRGWFYSLLILSTGLFDQSPYKNVIVNGTILAEDGQKMSKRLNNYPEVDYVLDKYGADAMRYYLLASPAVKAEDLAFSEKGVDEVVKKIIMRLENVYTFYSTYEKDKKNNIFDKAAVKNALDVWILARLDEVTAEMTNALENYELDKAARPIAGFVDDLSTWYLRRSRDRFKGDDEEDKQSALQTTRYVLTELSKLMAPLMPFLADDLYQKVKHEEDKESVHLEEWPTDRKEINSEIIKNMQEVRNVVSLALEARAKAGIKVRQPLASLSIQNEVLKGKQDLLSLVKEEINIKDVIIDAGLTEPVMLDTKITQELKEEGQAREFIRAVQELRKKANLNPLDVISLKIKTSTGKELIGQFEKEIKKTALIKELLFTENLESSEEIKIDNLEFEVVIESGT
jgi:isoleucyl-tRNA synthetase